MHVKFFVLSIQFDVNKGMCKGLSCLTMVFLGFAWKLNWTRLTFSFWGSLCIRDKVIPCCDSISALLLAVGTERTLGTEVVHCALTTYVGGLADND